MDELTKKETEEEFKVRLSKEAKAKDSTKKVSYSSRKSGKLMLSVKKSDFKKDYVFERERESDGTKTFLSEKDKEVKK